MDEIEKTMLEQHTQMAFAAKEAPILALSGQIATALIEKRGDSNLSAIAEEASDMATLMAIRIGNHQKTKAQEDREDQEDQKVYTESINET